MQTRIILGDLTNRMNDEITDVDEEITRNRRLAQINLYYAEKYKDLAELLTYVIGFLIVVLILVILRKRKILPTTVGVPLLFIVGSLGSILLIYQFFFISMRNNMVYSQLDFN